jgi:hypothetical protein
VVALAVAEVVCVDADDEGEAKMKLRADGRGALWGSLAILGCSNATTAPAASTTSASSTLPESSVSISGGSSSTSSGTAGGSAAASQSNASQPGSTPTTGDAAVGDDGGSSVEGGAGCVGVAITPDATGYVAPTSDSIGINGSWFVYSDCTDLGGVNCSTVMSPPASSFPNVAGSMCTSGTTSANASAWGAGIALELNDDGANHVQSPWDATAQSVTGFCFQLSGTAIPPGLRLAFKTTTSGDDAPFKSIAGAGSHTVLFSQTGPGSWFKNTSPLDTHNIVLVQFQIPSSSGKTIPWDFCVSGMTAVTQ